LLIISTMKLNEYLRLINEKPYLWAKANGLSQTVIYEYLRGRKKLMLSSALAISKATQGAVSLEELNGN
jgi:hypothetical protein